MGDLSASPSGSTARRSSDTVLPARQRKPVTADIDVDHRHAGINHSNGAFSEQTSSYVHAGNVGRKSKKMPNRQQASIGSQVFRVVCFTSFFFISCLFIFVSQVLGSPLYLYDKDRYYTWMAHTKRHFALLIIAITQIWSPTIVKVSGDESTVGQIRKTEDGGAGVELAFPERMVLIANHQLYTDWLYLWWSAYTSTCKAHGNIFIILKQSLRWTPLLGTGMSLYGFIWVSRHWAVDRLRFKHRLDQLKRWRSKPVLPSSLLQGHYPLTTSLPPPSTPPQTGQKQPKSPHQENKKTVPSAPALAPAPFWLLIFPEGTNLSPTTRAKSQSWATKSGQKDLKHLLLPRHTGLLFCLRELQGSVDWLYDCTMGYGGVPQGKYGSEIYTLRSTYLLPPSSPAHTPTVHLHWRRFGLDAIPLAEGQEAQFECWLAERWREKDELLEKFLEKGSFVVDDDDDDEDEEHDETTGKEGARIKRKRDAKRVIETEIKLNNPLEFITLLAPGLGVAVVLYHVHVLMKSLGLV